MGISEQQENWSSQIKAFLYKYARDRHRLIIDDDYEFDVLSFYDVDIPANKIAQLENGTVLFYGTAMVGRIDRNSGVSNAVRSNFHGKAFFTKDAANDEIIKKVCINRLVDNNV